MSTTSTAAAETTSVAKPAPRQAALPLDLVELELALDGFAEAKTDFVETLRTAARKVGGEYLFELPASGLAGNCRQIAALRLPREGEPGDHIVFALLDENGTAIRVEEPGEATEGLKSFAEAFVSVIETLNVSRAA